MANRIRHYDEKVAIETAQFVLDSVNRQDDHYSETALIYRTYVDIISRLNKYKHHLEKFLNLTQMAVYFDVGEKWKEVRLKL